MKHAFGRDSFDKSSRDMLSWCYTLFLKVESLDATTKATSNSHVDSGGKLNPIIVDAGTPPPSVSLAQHQTSAPSKESSSSNIQASRRDDASTSLPKTPEEAHMPSPLEDSTSGKDPAPRQADAQTPSLATQKEAHKASSAKLRSAASSQHLIELMYRLRHPQHRIKFAKLPSQKFRLAARL